MSKWCVKCAVEGKKKKTYLRTKLCEYHYSEAKAFKRRVIIPLRDYYHSLMGRCYKESWKLYQTYGARGYTVAEAWHSRDDFVAWGRRQGYKKGMKLILKDGCKEYGPDTCHFE